VNALNPVQPIFHVRAVDKTFGGRRPYVALNDVNLEVRGGEFLCILGASGCGKSTLLNLLAGFEAPTSGEVCFRGAPVLGPSRERVMFFQDSHAALLPWETVEENAGLGLRLQHADPVESAAVVEKCLRVVGLLDHRHKLPSEISGGMRQRLQIARALAVNPEVFLMDEPFGALDAITRRRMHVALHEVWESTAKTIVFVTHDIVEALTLADRIVIMNVGPRSRIRLEIKVDLPRPRDPADVGFGRLFKEIEKELSLDEVHH